MLRKRISSARTKDTQKGGEKRCEDEKQHMGRKGVTKKLKIRCEKAARQKRRGLMKVFKVQIAQNLKFKGPELSIREGKVQTGLARDLGKRNVARI